MTPDHPSWGEFVDRVTEALAGPDLVATGDVDSIINGALRGCGRYAGSEPTGHGAAFATCRSVLAAMDMDVEGSIEFFLDHGAGCDCTVMLNVANRYEEEGQ